MRSFIKDPKEFVARIVILLAFAALVTIDFYIMTGVKATQHAYGLGLFVFVNLLWLLIWCKQFYDISQTKWSRSMGRIIVFCGPIAQMIFGVWMIVAIALVYHVHAHMTFLQLFINALLRFVACVVYALFAANASNQIVASILSLLEPPTGHRG
jgi:hypothetical protein